MFRENRLLAEDFHETLYLIRNYGNISQNVSPAAIRIDARYALKFVCVFVLLKFTVNNIDKH